VRMLDLLKLNVVERENMRDIQSSKEAVKNFFD
jgi:hypothetical protein